jgi:hypothetical protein
MKNKLPIESVLIGLMVIGVFAAVFFFFAVLPKSTDQTIQGVRIVASGNAATQLKGIVSKNNPMLFEMELFDGNNSKNTALSIATAQIASNLVHFNHPAFVYGSINGNASINCVNETNQCTGAAVTLKIGPFNGLKINDTHVTIEGTENWFDEPKHLDVLSGLFGQAAS